jgi:hypothetical protein
VGTSGGEVVSQIKIDLWRDYIRKNIVNPEVWFSPEFDFEDILTSDEDSMELAIVHSDTRDVAEFIFHLFKLVDDLKLEIVEIEAAMVVDAINQEKKS